MSELAFLMMVTTFILPLMLGVFFIYRGHQKWGIAFLVVAVLCAPVGLIS